jgi:2-dehydropantoate 2-reductase
MKRKIVFVGAGGVGGYFGGQLARHGADVGFIARGAHLAAIRAQGLTVASDAAPVGPIPVTADDDPRRIGPAGVVVIAVKLRDTDAAIEQARPLMDDDSAIVSLQNGVEAVERLAAAFGERRVLGGVAHISAFVERPGVVRHVGTLARITVGELGGRSTPRLDAFAATLREAGIDVSVPPDIRAAIWEKFAFLSAFSGMTTVCRLPIGSIRSDALAREVLGRAFAESVAVAAASGVKLDTDAQRLMGFADRLPEQMRASMLGDLERGAPLELPWLSGAVARIGRERGVATPTHDTIVAALLGFAAGSAVR